MCKGSATGIMCGMSESATYTDIVGSVRRDWPQSYSRAITKDCPNCGAVAFTLCRYSPAKVRTRHPCVARTK